MAAIGNLITEAALDAMKRRGWVERTRERRVSSCGSGGVGPRQGGEVHQDR